jgi:hypothetical protein
MRQRRAQLAPRVAFVTRVVELMGERAGLQDEQGQAQDEVREARAQHWPQAAAGARK